MKYHEKDIFLLITNKCSLNCFSCGYGCENKNNNWFITKEEFINDLLQIKDTHLDGCNNYVISLTGGDPLLHKDWYEFAMLTTEIFPNNICYISTSGPLLINVEDKILLECHKRNIRFGITLYPSMKLLPLYKKIEEKFLRLGLLDFLTINPTKIFFAKPRIKNDNDFDCFQEKFSKVDYCFIYQNNLYNCQNLFYQSVKDNINYSSYNIFNINDDKNIKNSCTKKDCINCNISLGENVLWHFDTEIPKHCLFTPLKELFLHEYHNYYELQHNCQEHIQCLSNEFFRKYTPEKFIHPIAKTRFLSGKMDIFIPFNTCCSSEIVNLLNQQCNLDKYNIYFVSYTDDININSQMYDNFYDGRKNIFFLKAKNYTDAIHVFLQNSYLNKKYSLDINDYKILKDINLFEKISEGGLS